MVFPGLEFLRWYGVCWAVGLFLGYQVLSYIYKCEKIASHVLDRLVLYLFLGVIAGARLGHILFYDPVYYFEHPVQVLPFRVYPTFQFTGLAGLASHGGALGAIITTFWYCRRHKKSFLSTADRVVIAGCLLGSFIRLGNLMNSEILGKGTAVGWAFIFTRVDNVPRHPAQLYEAFGYLLTFIVLLFLWKKGKASTPGFLFGLCLTLVFCQRFIVEFLKIDQVPFEASLPLNLGQVLSVPLIITGMVLLVTRSSKARPGPGPTVHSFPHR